MFLSLDNSCCSINEFGGFNDGPRPSGYYCFNEDDEDDERPRIWKDIKTPALARSIFRHIVEQENDENLGNPNIAYTVDPDSEGEARYQREQWVEISRVLRLAGFRPIKRWYSDNHGNDVIMWFRSPFKRVRRVR